MKTRQFKRAHYDVMYQEIESLGISVKDYYYNNLDRLSSITLKTFIDAISKSRCNRRYLSNSSTLSVLELSKEQLDKIGSNKARAVSSTLHGEKAKINICYGNVIFEVESQNAPKLIADTILSLSKCFKE